VLEDTLKVGKELGNARLTEICGFDKGGIFLVCVMSAALDGYGRLD